MAEEMFPVQVDLKRVKFIIEQKKFWTVYARDTVHMSDARAGDRECNGECGDVEIQPLEEWVPSSAVSAVAGKQRRVT